MSLTPGVIGCTKSSRDAGAGADEMAQPIRQCWKYSAEMIVRLFLQSAEKIAPPKLASPYAIIFS